MRLSSRKAGRIRDKWRLKEWYTVYAPPYFGGGDIAATPADESGKLLGRVIEATLYDLTRKELSHYNIKVNFQVVKVEGAAAHTMFKGHEYAREYLRSLVRRGSTRVDGIFDITTKDGFRLRVCGLALTRKRIRPSQETGLRKIMQQVVEEKAKTLNFDQLVQEMVLGKVASDIYNRATKIVPLRHVGVRKSKLLAAPPQAEKELKAEAPPAA